MKWIKCADRLPPNPKDYTELKDYLTVVVQNINGTDYVNYYVLTWADGWNCTVSVEDGKFNKEHEITQVEAWAEIPPYRRGNEAV